MCAPSFKRCRWQSTEMLSPSSRRRERSRLLMKRVHFEHRRLERLPAAEGEQLIRQRRGPVGCVADFA